MGVTVAVSVAVTGVVWLAVGVAVFVGVADGTAVFVGVAGTVVGDKGAGVSNTRPFALSVGAGTTAGDSGATAAGCCRQESETTIKSTNQISRRKWGMDTW